MLKRLLLAGFAIALTASAVAIAQQWPNIPIVGGASYCASTVNAVCVSTIPAGPALTGDETIPADTNVVGSGPATVKIDVNTLGAGPYQYNAPLTGASLTLTAKQRRLILEPAGTIAALTVTFPAATALQDNQLMGICSTQTVTALTLTAGAGTTITSNPTILTLSTTTAYCYEFVYRQLTSSTGTWYRTQ